MNVYPGFLATALALSLLTAVAGAQTTPGTPIALSPNSLTIALDGCRVEISIADDHDPKMHVLDMAGSEISIESIGISVRNNTVRLNGPTAPHSLNDLIFSFTLDPTQALQIDGTDLDLTLLGPVPEDYTAQDPATDGTACRTPHLLNLVGGSARVFGGGCIKIVSAQTELNMAQTSQLLEIEATGGRFRIEGHRGTIDLNGRDYFSGTIIDHTGDLELVVEQGNMMVEGGAGAIHCGAEHHELHITERHGSLEATGTDAVFRIDHSTMETVKINGTRTLSQFSDGQGHIRSTLEGGSLTVADWTGRIDLQSSEGTTLDVDSLDGDIAFSATATTGGITAVTGHTRGSLTNSDVAFSWLKSIEITADGSEVSVEEVHQITQMNIIGGHLRYGSSKIAGKPKIHLSAEATAEILIPQPCLIRCTGRGAEESGSVSVSGCEMRAPNQPWGKTRRHAQPANYLEIEMQEFSEVFVSGY